MSIVYFLPRFFFAQKKTDKPFKELFLKGSRMSNTSAAREDFLEEDQEIPGQKFVLLSFLSPEKVLASKDVFFFTEFVKDYEIQYKTKKLEAFLVDTVKGINDTLEKEAVAFEKQDLSGAAVLCRSSQLKIESVVADLEGYVRKNLKEVTSVKISTDYDDYLFKNRSKLEEEFYAKNEFRTTVRGMKVRGTYSSQQEAIARSKKLQRNDAIHNIFVGEVGKWLAWDPDPNSVNEQEYAEDQLNTLMKKYKENEESRQEFYNEQRKKGVKTAGRGVHAMGGEQPESSTDASLFGPRGVEASSNAGATGSSYESMFNGPADLALERKLENTVERKA
jgi:hypothetical protein